MLLKCLSRQQYQGKTGVQSRRQFQIRASKLQSGLRFITPAKSGKLVPTLEFVRHMQVWGQNRPTLEKPPRDTYWPDLPYHFLIAPDGRIFEGRPVIYEPETNTKYSVNGNIGIEMMGDFEKQRPSLEQLRSCVALTAWLSDKYHIDLDHVRTHMDAAPDQTDCPGRDFYRYIKDGQFKKWVAETLAGKKPQVKASAPLPDGPLESVLGAFSKRLE